MLRLAIVLFIISILLALVGFGNIAASFAGIAKLLFYVFIVLFALAALVGALRGRAPV